MAGKKADQSVGVVRRALFYEVPYIIDRLWHWGEFLASRLGSVSFEAPWEYRERAAWRMPVFVLFFVVSCFLTFGPTADSLCLLIGAEGMEVLRAVLGVAATLATFYILLLISNRAMLDLAIDAERRADNACLIDPDLAERRSLATTYRHKLKGLIDRTGIIGARVRPLFSNYVRMLAACACLTPRDLAAYSLATVALLAGSAIVLLPLASVAFALLRIPAENSTCVTGPVMPLGWQFALLAAVTLLTGWFWTRYRSSLWQFLFATLLWAVLIGVLWFVVAPPEATEAQGGPYRQAYPLIVAVLLITAGIARFIARRLFANFNAFRCARFQIALRNTDLIKYQRQYPDVSNIRLFGALLNGVFENWRHWLLLPALGVFVAPSQIIFSIAFFLLVVSTILVAYGNLSVRWQQMLLIVERWFLSGTAQVVSYAVIIVALLRLFDVQYVSTIMDAAPNGVLLVIVVMAYTAIWYYEFWINRWVGESLLRLLGSRDAGQRGWITYVLNEDIGYTWAEKEGRVLALHGLGRFCAQGFFRRTTSLEGQRPEEFAFASYSYRELFGRLDTTTHNRRAHDVYRRLRLYYSLVNVVLVLLLALLAFWQSTVSQPLRSTAVVTARVDVEPAGSGGDLAARLAARSSTAQPIIVVAASGGGTRAAVYTAVALEGLGRLGLARDIALLSGVSGGGVASASYASRTSALTATAPNPGEADNPWTQYVDDMGDPFIQDVLEGLGELRIAGPAPLGLLLKESLERRIFDGPVQSFGELGNVGLILNTTVSGHPYTDSELLRNRVGVAETDQDPLCVPRPYSSLAGGRLIFTNVPHVDEFTPPPVGVPDMRLPYTIVQDPQVRLAAGGALTANFPPVFSNARVELRNASSVDCPASSYFVTDGGATENLGLVSALLAVDSAIDPAVKLQSDQGREASLSSIHVVAIEASAISYDYADDRGIGAATGGSKERINAGLTQRLIASLQSRLERHGAQLHVHYLTLPVVFRSRGGFGTHWMFAEEVTLANPLLATPPSIKERARRLVQQLPADEIALERAQLLTLWRALYSPEGDFCGSGAARSDWSSDMRRVAGWICGRDSSRQLRTLEPDWQVREWNELVRRLGKTGPAN